MDLYDHFDKRERECKELSLTTPESFHELCSELPNGDGIFQARFHLGHGATLSVNERIVVRGTGVHRFSYAYYLLLDGTQSCGFDRDAYHGEHMHLGSGHERHPCGRKTFREAVKRAWEIVSEHESITPPKKTKARRASSSSGDRPGRRQDPDPDPTV